MTALSTTAGGEIGDKIHAVLCAAGYNIRWLLRMIRAKGLRSFLRLHRAMAAIAVCGERPALMGLADSSRP
jgi:IS5 family transposase